MSTKLSKCQSNYQNVNQIVKMSIKLSKCQSNYQNVNQNVNQIVKLSQYQMSCIIRVCRLSQRIDCVLIFSIFLFVCDDGLYTDLTLLERSKMFPNVKGPTIFNDRTISNISQLSHWSPWPSSKSQFPTIDNLYYKKLLSC